MFQILRWDPEGPLFICRSRTILYGDVLKYLMVFVEKIGLDPSDAGLHSMRRSGAKFLQPLVDKMFMGDWKSLAVLTYLVMNYDRKLNADHIAAKALVDVFH